MGVSARKRRLFPEKMKKQPRTPSPGFFKILLWTSESLLALGAVLAVIFGLSPELGLLLFGMGSLFVGGPILFWMWMFGGKTESIGNEQREVSTRAIKLMPYLAAFVIATSLIRLIFLLASNS